MMLFGDLYFYNLGKYNNKVYDEIIKKDKEEFLSQEKTLFKKICNTDSEKSEMKKNQKEMYKMIK